MKLSSEEVELYYKLYHSLWICFNNKFNILNGLNSVDDIKNFTIEELNKLRKNLYEHSEIFDLYVKENPNNFPPSELKIVTEWKNFIKGRFYIVRHLKDYTIFLSTDKEAKAFGVIGLNSPLEDVVGDYLPILVEAVLLPFKDKIVYDSIIQPYSITFGRNIRYDINNEYQEAKARFGIITSLPFSTEGIKESDENKLKFYLKTENNRIMYQAEIQRLVNKSHELLKLYHQEMGKINARKYSKNLRNLGFSNVWFAILGGIIIASGPTKDYLEQVLHHILPDNKKDFVYTFQLKK